MDSQPDLQSYVFLQHLLTVSEFIQAITSIAPSYSTKKQREAVHMFASSLHELRFKSFTDEHLTTLKYIKLRLTEHLKVYASEVSKAKGNKWQNLKIWPAGNHKLMNLLKKNLKPVLIWPRWEELLVWSTAPCQKSGPEWRYRWRTQKRSSRMYYVARSCW